MYGSQGNVRSPADQERNHYGHRDAKRFPPGTHHEIIASPDVRLILMVPLRIEPGSNFRSGRRGVHFQLIRVAVSWPRVGLTLLMAVSGRRNVCKQYCHVNQYAVTEYYYFQ